MAYEVVMPYHLHMPSYFLETFTEYPLSKGSCGAHFVLEKLYDAHHHSLIILTGAMAFIYKPDALQTKHDATRC